jgi:hypothetical protein
MVFLLCYAIIFSSLLTLLTPYRTTKFHHVEILGANGVWRFLLTLLMEKTDMLFWLSYTLDIQEILDISDEGVICYVLIYEPIIMRWVPILSND